MRVLQVVDAFAPAVGGTERYVEALATRLAGTGDTVVVATMRAAGTPDRECRSGVEVIRLPSAVGRLRPTPAGTPSFLPTFVDPVFSRALSEVVADRRPDVVHTHGWAVHSALPAVRRHGLHLVAGLHDYGLVCPKKTMLTDSGSPCATGPGVRRCVPCGQGQYRGRVASAAVTLPLALARPQRWPVERFVANSAYVADTVARHSGIARARITVVPPSTLTGRDLAEPPSGTHAETRADEAPRWLPTGEFALYVGALGRHKGLDVLLRAHRAMRCRRPLVVLGAGQADPDLLADLHAGPDVVVRSDVAHADVMRAWRRATLGVVPSVWPEPFGQVAVECLASGTPVVVSDVGGLRELVDHERTGLVVPPGDSVALAAALDRLVADGSFRRRLGAAGRAACVDLTVEATTERIRALYAEVAGDVVERSAR